MCVGAMWGAWRSEGEETRGKEMKNEETTEREE